MHLMGGGGSADELCGRRARRKEDGSRRQCGQGARILFFACEPEGCTGGADAKKYRVESRRGRGIKDTSR